MTWECPLAFIVRRCRYILRVRSRTQGRTQGPPSGGVLRALVDEHPDPRVCPATGAHPCCKPAAGITTLLVYPPNVVCPGNHQSVPTPGLTASRIGQSHLAVELHPGPGIPATHSATIVRNQYVYVAGLHGCTQSAGFSRGPRVPQQISDSPNEHVSVAGLAS